MTDNKFDNTKYEDYVAKLPRLDDNDTIVFKCHSSIDCFNRCCGDVNLALSPYDVMRLRINLQIGSTEFMRKYAEVYPLSGNGFPCVMLSMRNDERQSCPFVTEEGCSVYDHRPGACRVYPLGRGASMDKEGKLSEEYILVRESHCEGFWEDVLPITVSDYLNNQGMKNYIEYDNRYIQVMHRWNARGRALDKKLFAKVFVAAYRPDELLNYLGDAAPSCDIVEKDDILSFETERLAFGLQWIEDVLFGD